MYKCNVVIICISINSINDNLNTVYALLSLQGVWVVFAAPVCNNYCGAAGSPRSFATTTAVLLAARAHSEAKISGLAGLPLQLPDIVIAMHCRD